jgi:hypothetical protein
MPRRHRHTKSVVRAYSVARRKYPTEQAQRRGHRGQVLRAPVGERGPRGHARATAPGGRPASRSSGGGVHPGASSVPIVLRLLTPAPCARTTGTSEGTRHRPGAAPVARADAAPQAAGATRQEFSSASSTERPRADGRPAVEAGHGGSRAEAGRTASRPPATPLGHWAGLALCALLNAMLSSMTVRGETGSVSGCSRSSVTNSIPFLQAVRRNSLRNSVVSCSPPQRR